MPQATDTVLVTPAIHSQAPPAVSAQHLTHTVPKLSTEAPVVSALQATLLALQATLLVLQDILLALWMHSMEAQAASVLERLVALLVATDTDTVAQAASALQVTLLALQATLLALSMHSMEAQAASVQLASPVRLGSALQDSALLPARTSLLLHLPRQPRPTKFCQMSDHLAQAYHFCDVPRLNETRL